MRHLELGVAPEVADDVHADPLVEPLLQLVGEGQILDDEGREREPEVGERGLHPLGDLLGQPALVRRHVEERNAARRKRLGHAAHHDVAELALQVGDSIDVARAAHTRVKRGRVREPVGVRAERAQPHDAEFLVPNGHRVGSSPPLVELQPRREEVNVRFEGGLERLVPVHEVGEHREGLGIQRVEPRAEDIGHLPFVHERRHLALAHGQLRPGLDLHVLHRKAAGEKAVFRLGPLDDIDELLVQEIAEGHTPSPCG